MWRERRREVYSDGEKFPITVGYLCYTTRLPINLCSDLLLRYSPGQDILMEAVIPLFILQCDTWPALFIDLWYSLKGRRLYIGGGYVPLSRPEDILLFFIIQCFWLPLSVIYLEVIVDDYTLPVPILCEASCVTVLLYDGEDLCDDDCACTHLSDGVFCCWRGEEGLFSEDSCLPPYTDTVQRGEAFFSTWYPFPCDLMGGQRILLTCITILMMLRAFL